MPRPRSTSRGTLPRLILFALLGWALYALRRDGADDRIEVADEAALAVERPTTADERPVERARTRAGGRRRRFATSLAFATLFFAGAALSAGAGDAIVEAIEAEPVAACEATEDPTDQPCPDEAATDASEAEDGGSADPAGDPAETEPAPEEGATGETAEESSSDEDTPTDETETTPTEGAEGGDEPAGGEAGGGSEPAEGGETSSTADGGETSSTADGGERDEEPGPPLIEPDREHNPETAALDPEAERFSGFATVWLHRTLPDPISAAKRLSPGFARQLRATSRRAGVEWTMVLAALRAQGHDGRVPATVRHLRSLADQIRQARRPRDEWQTFLALRGRTAFADRAMALTRYNRAVGLRALVTGFAAAKPRLAKRVLSDRRLDIYAGGRSDIMAGRIDVRVLVLMRYMAEAYGQATVSSLETGHGLYSRPGVVSAHIYGLAVDIAALGGKSIMGNSQPGGLTEHAVRDILLLPVELRPRQVISLLGLGGPSFPLANHHDHIHVGY
jgi:hypothetical protein